MLSDWFYEASTTKLLEENIGENIFKFGVDKHF